MLGKRQLLKSAGGLVLAWAGGTGTASPGLAQAVLMPFANGERKLARFPGKRPLIKLTERPPQLETPFSVFDESIITPNDAFFVRYHLAGLPLSIDPDKQETPPPPKTEETQQMESIVVSAQRKRKDTNDKPIVFSDRTEHAYEVTDKSITQAPIRSLGSVNCGAYSVERFGVRPPEGRAGDHSHPDSYGPPDSVPGTGDHLLALASSTHTAFMMTSKNVFTIEAMSNGTYRVTVSGEGISASQRSDLVGNMQNWENPAANAPGTSDRQRFCKRR